MECIICRRVYILTQINTIWELICNTWITMKLDRSNILIWFYLKGSLDQTSFYIYFVISYLPSAMSDDNTGVTCALHCMGLPKIAFVHRWLWIRDTTIGTDSFRKSCMYEYSWKGITSIFSLFMFEKTQIANIKLRILYPI